MKDTLTSALVLIILSTVTFYSCEKKERPMEQRSAKGDVSLGDKLRVAELETLAVMLPSGIVGPVATRVGSQLHCGLLRLDPTTLETIPGIAERWSVDEAGTSYVFHLRKRAMFHQDACFGNGSRMITAADFVFAFEQLCGSQGGKAFDSTFKGRVKGADAYRSGEIQTLEGVSVIDDYTLRIQLVKPDPSFLFVLAQPSTAVISEVAVAQYGKQSTVGAGPFTLVSSDPGRLLMARNPDYFQEDGFGNHLPYIDTLETHFMATREAQLEAFFGGGLDIVSRIYPDPVRSILEQHVTRFSGKDPEFVMQRDSEEVGYESYSIFRKQIKGYAVNFMGYQDYSTVQISQ